MTDTILTTRQAYTVNAFCEAFGIGKTQLYEEIAAGRIKTRKLGRRTLIRAEDAKAWLDGLPQGNA